MRSQAKAVVAVSALLLTLALSVTVAGAITPTVTIDPASSVSYTSAHLSGTVDPQGQDTTYYFQYAKDPVNEGWSYGLSQGLEGGAGVQGVSEDLTGLQPGAEYQFRLIAENVDGLTASSEPNPTFITDSVSLPSVSIDPVSSITDASAHFSGTINPSAPGGNPAAFDVAWHFECTPECPGLPGNQTIPADATDHVVSVDAKDLDPNSNYEVRLVAQNAGGSQSDQASFSTDAVGPSVEALPSAVITDASAWIGAKVNPRNSATTYYIEYSTDSGFTESISVPIGKDASAGAGNTPILVNHRATGLIPDTTYHYRVVAMNSSGTVSDELAFSTSPTSSAQGEALPDNREWERVSPLEKAGADIFSGNQFSLKPLAALSQAASDGDAVVYASTGKFGAADGGPGYSQYLARRGPSGWASEPVSPLHAPGLAVTQFNWYYQFTEDLSTGFAITEAGINPGDPTGPVQLYARDNATGTFRTISDADETTDREEFYNFQGASADGSQVVFEHWDSAFGAHDSLLLERTPAGDVRVVSVLPDGSSKTASLGNRNFRVLGPGLSPGFNPISDDGSRIFFTTYGDENEPLGNEAVYVRENGTTTRLVAEDGKFVAAARDGSVALHISGGALETSGDLFRWQADAPEGEQTSKLVDSDNQRVRGIVQISDDANTVYFVADSALTPGATGGRPNLYLWRAGQELRHVAALSTEDRGLWEDRYFLDDKSFRTARATPDGRYLAFASRESLTSYDTNGTVQIYMYDSQDGSLQCASCSAVEPQSEHDSWFLSSVGDACCESKGQLSRNLSSDGRRLFFDSDDALLPGDSNGTTDVYEWSKGRLHLLSGGTNARPSKLLDVSEDGDDVFFTTLQQLVRSDEDNLVDLYDARVDGAKEPNLDVSCVGDSCQGTPSPPPGFSSPSSLTFSGQGNSNQKTTTRVRRPACSRGKPRKPRRCAGKGKKRNKQTQKGSRR